MVGPYTDGSQPAEPPEQPTRWKWGFGCIIGSAALTSALAALVTFGTIAIRRIRKAAVH